MKMIFFILLMFLPLTAFPEDTFMTNFASQIEALEQRAGGHIGIAAINMANGDRLEYRSSERFALCSTFKLLLVAAILSRVDAGKENLDRMVEFDPIDILEYAPITKEHLRERKMSVAALSAAAIQYSDNTAANLLLQSLGGPEALTHYVQTLGDRVTRLDRMEPALNTNLPNDPRDTTTPSAMLDTMQKLLVGNGLSTKSRELLNSWLAGNTTGDKKLRAGINPAWKTGDKTGSGRNGASNDIAIIWPTGQEPFLVAVYCTGVETSTDQQNVTIAEVGRLVSVAFYPKQ